MRNYSNIANKFLAMQNYMSLILKYIIIIKFNSRQYFRTMIIHAHDNENAILIYLLCLNKSTYMRKNKNEQQAIFASSVLFHSNKVRLTQCNR